MIQDRNIAKNAAIAPSKIAGWGMGRVMYVCPADSTCRTWWAAHLPSADLFLTVKEAYDAATTGQNDVIVLSPDAHVIATPYMLTVSKNLVHFVGVGAANKHFGQRSRIDVNTDSGSASYPGVIKVTGVGCTFKGIKFRNNVVTIVESKNVLLDTGEYTLYENCDFYLAATTQATTEGLAEIVANGDSTQFKDCTIGSSANQLATTDLKRPCILVTGGTITGGKLRDNYFDNCILWRKAGHTSNAFVYGANATDVERLLLMKNCTFINSTLASADPAACVVFGAAQTEGVVLLQDCATARCTLLKTASMGTYVAGAVPTQNTTGVGVTG
jgi:hypothetical protein